MFGSAGFSGRTSWMNWLRRPRLNSAVQRVAVLTAASCARVSFFTVVDLSDSQRPSAARRAAEDRCESSRPLTRSEDVGLADRRTERGLEEIEVAALVGLQDVPRVHPAVAALEARRRRGPCGASTRELVV